MFSDGEPYTGGRIIYEQGTSSVIGRVDENGKFQLYSENPGDGVPAGSYRGFMSHDAPSPSEMRINEPAPPPPFAAKYANVDQSGLVFEVKPGEKKVLEIVLERSPQRARR